MILVILFVQRHLNFMEEVAWRIALCEQHLDLFVVQSNAFAGGRRRADFCPKGNVPRSFDSNDHAYPHFLTLLDLENISEAQGACRDPGGSNLNTRHRSSTSRRVRPGLN